MPRQQRLPAPALQRRQSPSSRSTRRPLPPQAQALQAQAQARQLAPVPLSRLQRRLWLPPLRQPLPLLLADQRPPLRLLHPPLPVPAVPQQARPHLLALRLRSPVPLPLPLLQPRQPLLRHPLPLALGRRVPAAPLPPRVQHPQPQLLRLQLQLARQQQQPRLAHELQRQRHLLALPARPLLQQLLLAGGRCRRLWSRCL